MGKANWLKWLKNPLRNPSLLQAFLDRHIVLDDLLEEERELLEELKENSAQLIPLEATAAQLEPKTVTLKEVNKKLEIAEAGKLMLIPMKVVTDSDLIPVSDSDAMPVAIGAKRRWPDYSGRSDRHPSTGMEF